MQRLDFPGGSAVKNLPAMQEMWVQSLGEEDPLEEGMEIHSSILAWRVPLTEEPGGLQFMGITKRISRLMVKEGRRVARWFLGNFRLCRWLVLSF